YRGLAATMQPSTTNGIPVPRSGASWANYFEVGAVTKAYRAIDNYTMDFAAAATRGCAFPPSLRLWRSVSSYGQAGLSGCDEGWDRFHTPERDGSRKRRHCNDPKHVRRLVGSSAKVPQFARAGVWLIPNPIDQNPWAHWRSPMDMMRQG